MEVRTVIKERVQLSRHPVRPILTGPVGGVPAQFSPGTLPADTCVCNMDLFMSPTVDWSERIFPLCVSVAVM